MNESILCALCVLAWRSLRPRSDVGDSPWSTRPACRRAGARPTVQGLGSWFASRGCCSIRAVARMRAGVHVHGDRHGCTFTRVYEDSCLTLACTRVIGAYFRALVRAGMRIRVQAQLRKNGNMWEKLDRDPFFRFFSALPAVCIYMSTYVHTCMGTGIRTHEYTCTKIMSVFTHDMQACVQASLDTCKDTRRQVCIHAGTHTHACTWTHRKEGYESAHVLVTQIPHEEGLTKFI